MKEYEFYLFDFDGCLAHTIDIIMASFEHTLGTLGQKREASVLRGAIGKPLEQQYKVVSRNTNVTQQDGGTRRICF